MLFIFSKLLMKSKIIFYLNLKKNNLNQKNNEKITAL